MNRKFFKLKLADSDASADEGIIEGHLSVKGNVDLSNEVVKGGAFKKTLQESKGRLPILWQHNASEPIGMWEEMREDATGLYVKGRINLEVERGREVFALLKQGAIKGLSIGYDVILDKVEKGVRYLLELKLWEGSVVTFPCNPLAMVSTVKAAADNKFMAAWSEMNDRQQVNASMRVAFETLDTALYTAAWSQEVDDSEATAYIDEALTQFHAAVLALFTRKRGYAQSDMGVSEKSLAMQDERIVVFKTKVDQTFKALLKELEAVEPGDAAHSDPAERESGAAETPKEPGNAHSDGTEPSNFAGLLEAIRSATPPPLE